MKYKSIKSCYISLHISENRSLSPTKHMEGCFHSIVSGLKKGQIKEKNKDQKCFVVLCATIQTTEIGYTLVLKRSMYFKNRQVESSIDKIYHRKEILTVFHSQKSQSGRKKNLIIAKLNIDSILENQSQSEQIWKNRDLMEGRGGTMNLVIPYMRKNCLPLHLFSPHFMNEYGLYYISRLQEIVR